MLDLLIKNAKICDGSGDPGFQGYVAVADGKIVDVEHGTAPGLSAARTIDADGLVLTPGFIDPHTHYDAQIAWDPLLTSTSWHGVTTVVQGNCGVGVAPLSTNMRESILRDLELLEEIPYELMSAVVSEGGWQSFGEYLDVIQKRGVGINVAPLVPLSPMRQVVMGEASAERAANDDERKALEHLFRQSIKDGGFGWSATFSSSHIGYGGRPQASRLADGQELEMLSRVLAEEKTGTVQIAFNLPVHGDVIEQGLDMLKLITGVSGRRVTYLLLTNDPENPTSHLQTVKKLGSLLDSRQVMPQFQVKPLTLVFTLKNPFVLCAFNQHLRSLLDKPYEYLRGRYEDPAFRTDLRKEFDGNPIVKGLFDRIRVLDGGSVEVAELMKSGKSISQIAADRGINKVDCLLDIALRDQLNTVYSFAASAYEPEGVKNLIRDGRFMPGLSDGGAHIQALNDTGYATHLLGHWCRDEQVVPLENAVRLLSSMPADVFGIKGRGRIAKGNHADLALIDFDKVGACPGEYVNDLPGGARRMVSRSTGVEATIVNGQILYEAGNYAGCLPGKMLRSGQQ